MEILPGGGVLLAESSETGGVGVQLTGFMILNGLPSVSVLLSGAYVDFRNRYLYGEFARVRASGHKGILVM